VPPSFLARSAGRATLIREEEGKKLIIIKEIYQEKLKRRCGEDNCTTQFGGLSQKRFLKAAEEDFSLQDRERAMEGRNPLVSDNTQV